MSSPVNNDASYDASESRIYEISHDLNANDSISFYSKKDLFNFGVFEEISLSGKSGSLIVSPIGNTRSHTLEGIFLSDLSLAKFRTSSQSPILPALNPLPASAAPEVAAQKTPSVTASSFADTSTATAAITLAEPAVYVIGFNWGAHETLAFRPAVDTIDFRYIDDDYISIFEQNGSTVIEIVGNNHSYTLDGVTFAELDIRNFKIAEEPLFISLLEDFGADRLASAGDAADVFEITWGWGAYEVIDFDPALDQLAFGWLSPDHLTIQEVNGSTVISMVGNNHAYVLPEIKLADLTSGNIAASDPNTLALLNGLIGDSGGETPVDPETPTNPSNPGAGGSTPVVAAYFADWTLYSHGLTVKDVPADQLTHLIYAASKIDGNGKLALFDTYSSLNYLFSAEQSVDGVADGQGQALAGHFNQLAKLKDANPDLTISLMIGGSTLSDKFSSVAATAASRETFVQSIVDFLEQYSFFTGIDLDWEFPGHSSGSPNSFSPADGANYALLLAELRDKLDALQDSTGTYYEITVDAPVSQWYLNTFNLSGLEPYVDRFNLMGYDYSGTWSDTVGHYAPLSGDHSALTIEDSVNLYLDAGVPASKIVLGTSAKGVGWESVAQTDREGLGTTVVEHLLNADGSGLFDYAELIALWKANPDQWDLVWDTESQAAILRGQDGTVYSFEIPASVATKAEWAKELGLGGQAFWELSGDARGADSLIASAWQIWIEGRTAEETILDSSIIPERFIGTDPDPFTNHDASANFNALEVVDTADAASAADSADYNHRGAAPSVTDDAITVDLTIPHRLYDDGYPFAI